jgi:hypothetical protein
MPCSRRAVSKPRPAPKKEDRCCAQRCVPPTVQQQTRKDLLVAYSTLEAGGRASRPGHDGARDRGISLNLAIAAPRAARR